MRGVSRTVSIISGAVILLIALLPVAEIVTRLFFDRGITGSSAYSTHLVLYLTFLGGISCSLTGKHLNIAAGQELLRGKAAKTAALVRLFFSVSITVAFSWSSLSMIFLGFDPSGRVGLIPIRPVLLIMPIGYLLMALGFIFQEQEHPEVKPVLQQQPGMSARIVTGLSGSLFGTILAIPALVNSAYMFPEVPPLADLLYELYYAVAPPAAPFLMILLGMTAFVGVPLFAVLGGIALLLFSQSWGSLEVLPIEAYSVLTGQTITAIPLFTVAGFILSESGAGKRLIALFRLLFRRLPGGMAAVAVIVCAFFTTFTGASGVTILALGGLLSAILLRNGFKENFVHGLLTASGSVGLLFPPSLPIILYGVVAQVSIRDMFLAGIIPGIVLVFLVTLPGFTASAKRIEEDDEVTETQKFSKVCVHASLEMALPIVVLVPYLSGITTIVETGAVTLVYALLVEMLIHRDISIQKLPQVLEKSIPIVGGVLLILASSRGLAYYLVDAQVPMQLASWMEANITSKLLFLLILNIGLLLTGCLMDIFSAIMVVVPLILPLGALFGVHPVHLGIIFLANLELGYITPPVGLNLFMASYRFERPLADIYRSVLPFFFVRIVAVLLITYLPFLSLILIRR